VHSTPIVEAEKESIRTQGIPKARKEELIRALDTVVRARKVFESAKPRYPVEHRHFVVVALDSLVTQLHTDDGKSKMKMSTAEIDSLVHYLEKLCTLPSTIARRTSLFPAFQPTGVMVELNASKKGGLIDEVDETTLAESEEREVMAMSSNHSNDEGARKSIESIELVERPRLEKTASISSKSNISNHTMRLAALVGVNMRRSSSETDISFSAFLQCVQMVCREKVVCGSRRLRESYVSGDLSAMSDGFTSFLY
jgi:hypothetical protein